MEHKKTDPMQAAKPKPQNMFLLSSLLVALFASIVSIGFIFIIFEDSKPTYGLTRFETVYNDFVQSHPEIRDWSARALLRFNSQPNATHEDLSTLRSFLQDAQKNMSDFVQSSEFNTTAALAIEKLVNLAEPFLGILPSSEMGKVKEILMKDSSVVEFVAKRKEELPDKIKSIMTQVKEFDNDQVRAMLLTDSAIDLIKEVLQTMLEKFPRKLPTDNE